LSLATSATLGADDKSSDTATNQKALIAAIHHYADRGDLKRLRAILDKHPELVDVRLPPRGKPSHDEQYTPLHRAAELGGPDVVEYLLSRGADIEADSGSGWRPLHLSARLGNLRTIRTLVEKGASLQAKTCFIEETVGGSYDIDETPMISPAVPSMTPLEIAEKEKHKEVAKYLRARLLQQRSPAR
jgi:hypothetical protein